MNFQIKDDFLNSFKQLKSYCKTANFETVQNEVDGAVYPAICQDIPLVIKNEFIEKIEDEKGFKIKPNLVFLRANPKGAPEPYQAHNDKNMGDYTAILYINPVGGTSFVEHKETGIKENVPELFDHWLNDCNDFESWSVYGHCEGKENRVLMFDSELMHRGEPVDGYGKGNDSRMIMVCFYEKA